MPVTIEVHAQTHESSFTCKPRASRCGDAARDSYGVMSAAARRTDPKLNGVPGILFIDAEFTISWEITVSYGTPIVEAGLNEGSLKATGQTVFGETIFRAAASATGKTEAEVANKVGSIGLATDLRGQSLTVTTEVFVRPFPIQTPYGKAEVQPSNKGTLSIVYKAFIPAHSIGTTVPYNIDLNWTPDQIEAAAALGAGGSIAAGVAWAISRAFGSLPAFRGASGSGIFIFVPAIILQPYENPYEGQTL